MLFNVVTSFECTCIQISIGHVTEIPLHHNWEGCGTDRQQLLQPLFDSVNRIKRERAERNWIKRSTTNRLQINSWEINRKKKKTHLSLGLKRWRILIVTLKYELFIFVYAHTIGIVFFFKVFKNLFVINQFYSRNQGDYQCGQWQVHLAFPVLYHTTMASVGMFRPLVSKIKILFCGQKMQPDTEVIQPTTTHTHTARSLYQPWNILFFLFFVVFFNCYELDESQSVGTKMAPSPTGRWF